MKMIAGVLMALTLAFAGNAHATFKTSRGATSSISQRKGISKATYAGATKKFYKVVSISNRGEVRKRMNYVNKNTLAIRSSKKF